MPAKRWQSSEALRTMVMGEFYAKRRPMRFIELWKSLEARMSKRSLIVTLEDLVREQMLTRQQTSRKNVSFSINRHHPVVGKRLEGIERIFTEYERQQRELALAHPQILKTIRDVAPKGSALRESAMRSVVYSIATTLAAAATGLSFLNAAILTKHKNDRFVEELTRQLVGKYCVDQAQWVMPLLAEEEFPVFTALQSWLSELENIRLKAIEKAQAEGETLFHSWKT